MDSFPRSAHGPPPMYTAANHDNMGQVDREYVVTDHVWLQLSY